jgi:folate-binding protein YgfZ
LNCEFARLEQEALLHISGPDALTFLQGQTTCDTRIIDREHALPGAYCTPQGRVVCDFLLTELGAEHYALRVRRDIRTVSSSTFGKYIVFSKATLEDSREDWQVTGIWGTDAAAAVQTVFGAAPAQRFGALSGDGFVLVRMDEQGRQFECCLHDSRAGHFHEAMGEVMAAGTEAGWQAVQIASGLARIEAASVEEYVPQSLNYDLTGHISFDKGCYTGQEVVARLHYRGKPKRRTYLAELPAGTATSVGTKILDAATGKATGSIVNVVAAKEGTCALIEATAESLANGLKLDDGKGTSLVTGMPPYPLPGD